MFVNHPDESIHSSVLIVSDDTQFARVVMARWQAERHVPEMTLATSDIWRPAGVPAQGAVIIGQVRPERVVTLLSSASASACTAILYVAEDEKDAAEIHSNYPQLLVLPRQDGWTGTLVLLATEALRRVEAVGRAQRAERSALQGQGQATLGRYMLEMRPSVNNALTSILGNSDLLLLEPGRLTAAAREQIHTIRTMAVRLNEVMQRFSSLVTEMRAGEKESQDETEGLSHPLAARS